MNLFFVHYLEYPLLFVIDNVDEESEWRSLASGCCLAFFYFFNKFRLTLLIKVLLIKKRVNFYLFLPF